jgi:hypothetical protein
MGIFEPRIGMVMVVVTLHTRPFWHPHLCVFWKEIKSIFLNTWDVGRTREESRGTRVKGTYRCTIVYSFVSPWRARVYISTRLTVCILNACKEEKWWHLSICLEISTDRQIACHAFWKLPGTESAEQAASVVSTIVFCSTSLFMKKIRHR